MSDMVKIADPRWAVVWCRGRDAVPFLQGLVTADLDDAEGQVRRSFLLSPQGKLVALLWVLVGAGEVALVCDVGVAERVKEELLRFRIRVKADVEVGDEPVGVVVGEAPPTKGRWDRVDNTISADISAERSAMTLLIGSPPAELETMSVEEWTLHRVEMGEPVMGVDVDERTIPQETGRVPSAVSFTKGCYLGQELVARIDTRGHVNQRLAIVESDAPFERGAIVRGAEREASVTSSAVRPDGTGVGLAVVRREIEDDSEVEITTSSGPVTGTIRSIP